MDKKLVKGSKWKHKGSVVVVRKPSKKPGYVECDLPPTRAIWTLPVNELEPID